MNKIKEKVGQPAAIKLQTLGDRQQTADDRQQTADCKVQIADGR
jgi:hypothetical protein